MKSLLPPLLRMLFPGHQRHFTFTRKEVPVPLRPDRLNFYVHIPFCRRICAFCPYVEQVYDHDALRNELQRYRNAWGDAPIESVYFVGGTPSLAPGIVNSLLNSLGGQPAFQHRGRGRGASARCQTRPPSVPS